MTMDDNVEEVLCIIEARLSAMHPKEDDAGGLIAERLTWLPKTRRADIAAALRLHLQYGEPKEPADRRWYPDLALEVAVRLELRELEGDLHRLLADIEDGKAGRATPAWLVKKQLARLMRF